MNGNLVKAWKKYELLRLRLTLQGDFDFDADRRAYAYYVEGREKALVKLTSTRKNNRRFKPLTDKEISKARANYAKTAGTIR